MHGRIPEEKIQEIRDRNDIVEVVSSYLPLKATGPNNFGLCPFHHEKSPSFNVNAARQIFHCFGCGVSGNVFSFLMRMEGLSFVEAVRRLGDRVGVQIERETLSPEEQRRRHQQVLYYRINEAACDFFHANLMRSEEGKAARDYLKKRGYGHEIAREFRLGYALDRWDGLTRNLAEKGFEGKDIQTLGLTRPGQQGRGDYDLFRGRLIFPILDLHGQVQAFGGRVLGDELPKYLNSPESPIYHKARILYGLYQGREEMRRTGEAIVVEGYFDQLALHRAGFPQAVATCGTALTEEHAQLLKRYAKKALLLFDQDEAGRRATFKAMDVLQAAGLPAAVITLDEGDDPDSFLAGKGAEAFRHRLQAARPVMEVFIDDALARHGASVEGKAKAVEEIAAKLRGLTDAIERSLYVRAVAQKVGFDESLLQAKVSGRRPSPPAQRQEVRAKRPSSATPSAPASGLRAQMMLLYLLLREPQAQVRVKEEGVENLFLDANIKELAEKILNLPAQETPSAESLLSLAVDEAQKDIVRGVLREDAAAFAEEEEAIFVDCRQAVAKEKLRRRRQELNQLVQRAESCGDQPEMARLQAELMQVNRQLK
ncbi:DNA primase [Desulfuromonas sp. AOP6]|uniref:DNA primase n=1 Tax=Desulfuromonas sp. AOP6 TaxID=1566351 RepID=UPI00126C87C1|nr:DNA primase [Desulfuromonas sp. AOP6]BCA78607.1 DNA primase [Desulfuromonas sp. AOP6]